MFSEKVKREKSKGSDKNLARTTLQSSIRERNEQQHSLSSTQHRRRNMGGENERFLKCIIAQRELQIARSRLHPPPSTARSNHVHLKVIYCRKERGELRLAQEDRK